MMNVGVIGAGRIGKLHAENLVLRIQETNVRGNCGYCAQSPRRKRVRGSISRW